MLVLKMKLAAILLGMATSAARVAPGDKVVYGPTNDGRYAVPGEGFIPTKDCTVTADGMRAEYDGRFITFLDREGQEEGQCEAGVRPVVRIPRAVIRRGIATVGGR